MLYDFQHRFVLQYHGYFDAAVGCLTLGGIVARDRARCTVACGAEVLRIGVELTAFPRQQILQNGVGPVGGELAVCLGGAGDVGVAGNDDAVDIAGVLRVAQEFCEYVDKLVEYGLALRLYRRGAEVEEHALVENDIAVVADADLALVAHDVNDTRAYLFEYGHAQHRYALHLRSHGTQLPVGCRNVALLVADKRLLRVYRLCLLVYLYGVGVYLVLLQLELVAELAEPGLRGGDLPAGVGQHLLRVLQVVAGYEVLYV